MQHIHAKHTDTKITETVSGSALCSTRGLIGTRRRLIHGMHLCFTLTEGYLFSFTLKLAPKNIQADCNKRSASASKHQSLIVIVEREKATTMIL